MKTDFQNVLERLQTHIHPSSSNFLTQETYVLAIESAFNMIVITDRNGVVQYANPAVERITGYRREEILGHKVGKWGGLMDKSYYQNLWLTILNGKDFNGELQNHRKNGDVYTARLTISPIIKNKIVIGFVGTEEDITLKEKLQKEKEEFISLASHQLRTPLGAMKWNLELLVGAHPALKPELSNLSTQNQYMIDLVNRLLVVMRIGDNRLEVKKKKTEINKIIEIVVSHFQERISNSGISFVLCNINKNVSFNTDPILLQEIISNLIDNAIKYSKHGGKVTMKIIKNKIHWGLEIRDVGIGIAHKDLPHIFDKFTRGSNTMSIPGTGLGMYIIKTYIHKLGGTIDIESKVGKGTRIRCFFPL